MFAALLVVPGLLVLFHGLSRNPLPPSEGPELSEEPTTPAGLGFDPVGRPTLEPFPTPSGAPASSVADEAELWLNSRQD